MHLRDSSKIRHDSTPSVMKCPDAAEKTTKRRRKRDVQWNKAVALILNDAPLHVPTWPEEKKKKKRPDRRSQKLERRRRVGLVGRQRSGGQHCR
ncbi:hypothetical protein HPB52_023563 [Rhipicephalus sanguineus]|uniref:Uncharacterized protein n=1 Tax=Rhipicephalus sanguineus TaxID=34632 RepID=A0A9D4PGE1_RHISA|nr:hypothetical protein HPB52_023563 [Rhipicephalus sanguineus]